jgi:putative nucleotidyltransferase with HDIG domain
MTRDEALALMHEYTASEALRRHMYAVEIAMRAMAPRYGGDADQWGLAGLLHDFDYERFPNDARSATEEHPAEGVRILAARGVDDAVLAAILGHAAYTGVPREADMARALLPWMSCAASWWRVPWYAPRAVSPTSRCQASRRSSRTRASRAG